MKKNLLIMRHAKSSWAETGLSDHDRPLNKRGIRDTPQMAGLIARENLVPDLVLASTANRACRTAELFVESCEGITVKVETTDEFYHAPAYTYIETVLHFPDSVQTALVVGHNPGMEELVDLLCGNYERMPTAAIAWFTFEIQSWSQLRPGDAILETIWRPKEI